MRLCLLIIHDCDNQILNRGFCIKTCILHDFASPGNAKMISGDL